VRRILCLLLLATACRAGPPSGAARRDSAASRAGDEAPAPVVRGPTVVAFWLPASDTLADSGSSDLLDEFRASTAQIAPALQAAEIALIATAADSVVVEREGGPRRVISLRGLDYPFGYVLVEPGYPETILTGMSTDDELLDEVTWYFGLEEADPDVGVGRVWSIYSHGAFTIRSHARVRIRRSAHRARGI
jgi:hypothetical protein